MACAAAVPPPPPPQFSPMGLGMFMFDGMDASALAATAAAVGTPVLPLAMQRLAPGSAAPGTASKPHQQPGGEEQAGALAVADAMRAAAVTAADTAASAGSAGLAAEQRLLAAERGAQTLPGLPAVDSLGDLGGRSAGPPMQQPPGGLQLPGLLVLPARSDQGAGGAGPPMQQLLGDAQPPPAPLQQLPGAAPQLPAPLHAGPQQAVAVAVHELMAAAVQDPEMMRAYTSQLGLAEHVQTAAVNSAQFLRWVLERRGVELLQLHPWLGWVLQNRHAGALIHTACPEACVVA
jgi:hypothetical protein